MVPIGVAIGGGLTKGKQAITLLWDQPKEDVARLSTGFRNLDLTFGGHGDKIGLAAGFVIQLGGQPGCGKSTLLAHIASHLKEKCLYVTTEESKRRLAARVRRVAGDEATKHMSAISTIDDRLGLTGVCIAMRTHQAKVIIIDSLQGLRKDDAIEEEDTTAAASVSPMSRQLRSYYAKKVAKHSQMSVRDIAMELIKEANRRKVTMLMVCHVTKDGALAGLKEIEHMVDCVAWFKGDVNATTRTFSCSKNREGDTTLSADFDMTEHGLFPRATEPNKTKIIQMMHAPQSTKLSDAEASASQSDVPWDDTIQLSSPPSPAGFLAGPPPPIPMLPDSPQPESPQTEAPQPECTAAAAVATVASPDAPSSPEQTTR